MQERKSRVRTLLGDFGPLALIFALLIGVSFLPPDTSAAEVDRLGRLRVCMPTQYPPLVTGNPEAPGFDVELLTAIAHNLGWRLDVISNSNMGRDYNPRSWRLTRAQCSVIAGGIALTQTSRSFLDTSEPYLRTGWAYVKPINSTRTGGKVGVYVGLTGLDRIALAQYLRGAGIQTEIMRDPASLARALDAGEIDAAITEALLAAQTFSEDDHDFSLLPEPLERINLGFGFWKGDLTLRRAVEGQLHRLWADGTVDALAEKYDLASDLLLHPGENPS
ncbi:MAG TPA: transporter substrate-binding domain-containing protein [Pelagibacterium sp.]|uniref:substrate-binding periplasmic protein n=1 Tax=Pelagibacterium sp. TaxID=1967288 RepID=UPI002B7C9F5C|nr:transporter substrate-binding domain-containing protein [Pelagibacterium sp.]HWJ88745.1 transporter substrate-binding domain-containing protein [Pelagibacterium sp.]